MFFCFNRLMVLRHREAQLKSHWVGNFITSMVVALTILNVQEKQLVRRPKLKYTKCYQIKITKYVKKREAKLFHVKVNFGFNFEIVFHNDMITIRNRQFQSLHILMIAITKVVCEGILRS